MLNLEQPETRFAINIVREASLLVKRVQAKMVSPAITKGDYSPVTVADFASQALVGKALAEQFPDQPLVAEEDSSELRKANERQTLQQVTKFVSERFPHSTSEDISSWIDYGASEPADHFWTLDPIDGTKGFLRGDQYAVALALIARGKVQIGVLGCPNISEGFKSDPGGLGTLAVAVRGEGAWHTELDSEPGVFKPLKVSDTKDPEQARLLRSYESGHTNVGQMDYLADELSTTAEPVRMDSQAKYMVLAAGKAELYLRFLSPRQPDYKEKIWDQAAGSLIVEEAGGKVSDLYGLPLDFTTGRTLRSNRGVLASNKILHQAALNALRAINT
ncbi:MAG: 3'(2'),5'-bisphosphate nucleotidase [Anaerolineales bacterium]|jgi:3'(2'), 5'-bisphosphate nucleotidase